VIAPSLKGLAWTCKLFAIAVCAVMPLLILRPRWHVSVFDDAQIVGLAILSVIPNRWLVFSRIPFVLFLLAALSPFRIFLSISAFRQLDLASAIAVFISVSFMAPLPLSIALGRMRFLRGDKVMYV